MNKKELLDSLVKECEYIVKSCGFALSPNITYKLNARFTRALGRCTQKGLFCSDYIIEVAELYFTEYARLGMYKEIKQTILHEMCHTLPNGMNHASYGWQQYVNEINRKYGYNIHRQTVMDNVIRQAYTAKHQPKYILKCEKCGNETYFQKKPKYLNMLWGCSCKKCGGNIHQVK